MWQEWEKVKSQHEQSSASRHHHRSSSVERKSPQRFCSLQAKRLSADHKNRGEVIKKDTSKYVGDLLFFFLNLVS